MESRDCLIQWLDYYVAVDSLCVGRQCFVSDRDIQLGLKSALKSHRNQTINQVIDGSNHRPAREAEPSHDHPRRPGNWNQRPVMVTLCMVKVCMNTFIEYVWNDYIQSNTITLYPICFFFLNQAFVPFASLSLCKENILCSGFLSHLVLSTCCSWWRSNESKAWIPKKRWHPQVFDDNMWMKSPYFLSKLLGVVQKCSKTTKTAILVFQ